MISTLTKEQQEQFSDILESLGKTLDITPNQYDAAVTSYKAVGEWLSQDDSPLALYNPVIIPQGSFMLGLMVKPIHENDDLDIDLVCQLTGKRPEWTQYHLKDIVGKRIKDHGTYREMVVSPDGRRCWTLKYADAAHYHMDILPCIVSEGYTILLEKSLSAVDRMDFNELAIRITDKKHPNFWTSPHPEDWLKSNPFGYGKWFFDRATIDKFKAVNLSESVKPVPKYQKDKLPLQRVIQILKRHRDMMFNGNEDKPISIIITTLAARAYQKETSIITSLQNILDRITLPAFIEERYDARHGRFIKWIPNPVNLEENFADKWAENPQKEVNFYQWVKKVRMDVLIALGQTGKGLYAIQNAMDPFGARDVTKAFNDYGEKTRILREKGEKFFSASTGLGTAGTLIKNHNFHGRHE